jgi:predicted DNA-binding transcriptional regulator AlpA
VPADLADLQLLDIKAVGALVGLKSSAIQDRVRRGDFPEPIRMGARCTRWPAGAVRQWLRAQIEAQQEDMKQRQQARAKKASNAAQARRQAATQAVA